MRVTSIRSEGLEHLSYFISSENEAIVIDPRRDVEIYLELASQADVQITHVFETHRNEDYVIGSLELQHHIESLKIGHSEVTNFKFGDLKLADGDSFKVGKMKVTCNHTPGHTDDSMCYAVSDTAVSQDPIMIFTGDTLFVNEVGRTDLVDITKTAEMAGKLFDSLHDRLLKFSDGIIIYPGHGAGSVCGANIGDREFSTIGYERANNIWLAMDKDEFIENKVNQGITLASYFKHCEKLNTIGPPLVSDLPTPEMFSPAEFKEKSIMPNHIVIDTRSPQDFVNKHIPTSISLSFKGMGLFAGWVLNPSDSFLFVLNNENDLDGAKNALIRIGFDNIVGYLGGGIDAWIQEGNPTDSIRTFTAQKLNQQLKDGNMQIIDVRQPHEFEVESIEGSISVPLTSISEDYTQLSANGVYASMCPSGIRATTGASILKNFGVENISISLDGLKGWKNEGYNLKG
jgi:hydroxyacylglutathione hydrolase